MSPTACKDQTDWVSFVRRCSIVMILACVFSGFGLGAGPTAPGIAEAQVIKRLFKRTGQALKRTRRRIRRAFHPPRASRRRTAKRHRSAGRKVKQATVVRAGRQYGPRNGGQLRRPTEPPAPGQSRQLSVTAPVQIAAAREAVNPTPPLPVKQPRPWHKKQRVVSNEPRFAPGAVGINAPIATSLDPSKNEAAALDWFEVLATFGNTSADAAEYSRR